MRWLIIIAFYIAALGGAEASPTPPLHPLFPDGGGAYPTDGLTQEVRYIVDFPVNPDAKYIPLEHAYKGPRPQIFGVSAFMLLLHIGFVVAVVTGVLGSRITLVGGRGPYAVFVHPALGLTANLSFMATFVWGFINLQWYWPLIAFFLATVLSALMVNHRTLVPLLRMRWAIDLITIAGATVLWLKFGDL